MKRQADAAGRGFDGQHVVIVGGNSGIGLAVAKRLAGLGADLTLVARDEARLALVATDLAGGGATRPRTVALDVRDEPAVRAAAASIPPARHVFVSAASFAGGDVFGESLTEARAAFDARVWGALHVVRAFAPRMRGPQDSIVLTGGISTDRPTKGAWPTAIGTAATEQLARLLAVECAPLRANAVSPGWTDTPMWDGLLGEGKAETFAGVQGQIPTGRIATADEVAAVVAMLMSNLAMNGEIVHVDGGHRLR